MDDLNDQEIAILTLAEQRRKIAAAEAMTGQRGPVSEALRERGITLGPASVEAVFEMFFWDGVASGLRAAHDESARARLRSMALDFPGFEDR